MNTMLFRDTRQPKTEAPSGYSTPPPSFDGRRDSLASQASYCQSFASPDHSGYNDYSMPVTPQSPMTQEGFIDVSQYDMAPPIHGLPFSQKEPGLSDNLYEPYVVVPPSTMVPSPNMLPSSESGYEPMVMIQHPTAIPPVSYELNSLPSSTVLSSILHPMNTAEQNRGRGNMSFAEPSWQSSSSMITWPGDRPNRTITVDPSTGRVEGYELPWNPMESNPFGNVDRLSSGTIIPSEAMVNDYVHVHTSSFDNMMGNSQNLYTEEVSFGRDLPTVKEELGVHAGSSRMRVRSTGAKGVKRERRGGSSKMLSSADKFGPASKRQICDGVVVQFAFEKGIRQDEMTGKICRDGNKPEKKYCDLCKKGFQRPEHLKRHIKSHTNHVAATCEIPKCKKPFGRNDNCIAHYATHIRKPGRKEGRNQKMSLRRVLGHMSDPKMIEKVRKHSVKFELEEGGSDTESDDMHE